MADGLASIEHVVVLMLENRSFDHMLGFLYTGAGNVSPSSQPFDGLTGTESNPDASGQPVTVFKIEPGTPNAYFMPGADPGEGYTATNDQLYGSDTAPAAGTAATNQGFVTNYAYSLGWEARTAGPSWPGPPRTTSWAVSPRRRCWCCPRWPPGTPSATSGFPRHRPRPCRTVLSRAQAPARATWTTRRTRSPRPASSAR